jgi:8-oxo-dGTP diphosphatase
MTKVEEFETGIDFYLQYKGRRMLDEPLHFILKSLHDETISREFLEFGGEGLFNKKLRILCDYLGEPDVAGFPEVSGDMLCLMERFEVEKDGIMQYLKYGRPPSLTVDGVIIREGRVVLIRRGNEPFKNMYALPGGFVEYGERTEDAVIREVREETGLDTKVRELLGVYSDPGRDPRGHVVSTIYLLDEVGGELKAGDDAAGVELVDHADLPELAFDHTQVMGDALSFLNR